MANQFKFKRREIVFDFDGLTTTIAITDEIPDKIEALQKCCAETSEKAKHSTGTKTMHDMTYSLMDAIDEFLEADGISDDIFERAGITPNAYDCMDLLAYIFETVTESVGDVEKLKRGTTIEGTEKSLNRAQRRARRG